MDPTLDEWALDFALSWLLLRHHCTAPRYTQWVFYGQIRIGIAQLTSASAHLQDRNTGSFLGLSFFLVGNTPHLSPGVLLCSYRQWMSHPETEGTFVMILLYILGGESQKN